MTYANAATAARGRYRRHLAALGASLPVPDPSLNTSMTFSLNDPDVAAAAAISAITANPTAVRNRTPIPEVRSFQSVYGHGLVVDGIYGPATRSALVTVSGRSDLPSAGSSSSSSTLTTPYVSTTPAVPAYVDATSAPSGAASWLVPVAVVSTLVLVAGGLMVRRRRAMRANTRRRHRRSR